MELEDSRLFFELKKRNKESQFAINIKSAFEYVNNILPMIVTVFTNYTQHDVGHSLRVANYMYDLMEDIDKISDLEIALMLFSALFHDIGMIVSEAEIDLIKDDNLEDVKCKYTLVWEYLKNEKLALQECIRPIHAIRSAQHLQKLEDKNKVWFRIPGSTNLSILEDVEKLCQSHNESIDWIKTELDAEGYKGKSCYNLQYIALLLRLADLLDFDEQRTPDYLYKLINPKGFSDSEWKQHFIIHNTQKIYINEKNRQKVIRFFGESSEPGIHRKFLKYVDYINKELLEAINISDTFLNTKYALNIKSNIENKVKTNRFTFSDFKLDLDYNAVTNLLMGERIYGDKKHGLRELVQNSIDACMLMGEVAKTQEEFLYESYRPYINIVLNQDKNEAVVVDNGIGMSLDVLKKYFLNVGVSYYSSNEYKYKGYNYRPIGNYGIGFLACFMLSDNVKVNTKRYDDSKLNCIELESNSEYICLRQASTLRKQGTEVLLDLQDFNIVFQNFNKVQEFIETNFVSCGIPIKIVYIQDGNTKEYECKLTEFKENSNTIAKLDKYLNDITGYVEISNVSIDFIKCLDDVDGNDAYLYDDKTNVLLRAEDKKINLNDFILEGKINYLSVPLIAPADADEFKKYLEVLEDFNEAISKLNSAAYINIFSLSESIDEYAGQYENDDESIIGNYTFRKLCDEHGHDCKCPTYLEKQQRSIIKNDSDMLLPYDKNKIFGTYSWERKDRVFVKNVFVSDFAITVPFLVDGIKLKSALFNLKNKCIIPNVARNNVPKEDSEKFSYAIGKALHLWILENVSLSKTQKELVQKVVNECYLETNELLFGEER